MPITWSIVHMRIMVSILKKTPFIPLAMDISQYGIWANVNSRNQILLELTMLPLSVVRRVSINLLLLLKLDTGSPLANSNGVSLRPLHCKSNKDLSLKQTRVSRQIAELPKHWGLCFYTAQNCVMAPEALYGANNSTEQRIASWKSGAPDWSWGSIAVSKLPLGNYPINLHGSSWGKNPVVHMIEKEESLNLFIFMTDSL